MTNEFPINIEPSWEAVANIAIMLIENGDDALDGKEKGRELVREMGAKLAQVRATQPDCPPHLAQEEDAIAEATAKIVRRGFTVNSIEDSLMKRKE
jgi:hypothetical protein